MKLSFDGIRKNLARAYNDLAETELSDEVPRPIYISVESVLEKMGKLSKHKGVSQQ